MLGPAMSLKQEVVPLGLGSLKGYRILSMCSWYPLLYCRTHTMILTCWYSLSVCIKQAKNISIKQMVSNNRNALKVQ